MAVAKRPKTPDPHAAIDAPEQAAAADPPVGSQASRDADASPTPAGAAPRLPARRRIASAVAPSNRRKLSRTTIRLADPMTTRLGTRVDPNALIFDSDWYRAMHPDVAASRLDPVRHYLDNGAREGRDPNPYFDTSWYVTENPDVAASGYNPFLHFLLYGAQEGRLPAAPAKAAPLEESPQTTPVERTGATAPHTS